MTVATSLAAGETGVSLWNLAPFEVSVCSLTARKSTMHRRLFLRSTLAAGASAALSNVVLAADRADALIIDTHQHLWDLSWQELPWLQGGGPLSKNFTTVEYLEAIQGYNVKAVYMEVDVAAKQKRAEVEHVVKLSRDATAPTIAAVVGGQPGSSGFAAYVDFIAAYPEVKGVRQVLHGGHPQGTCLSAEFIKSIQLLGDKGLSFDLCMRSTDLADGVALTQQAPDTRYVLDHCGNMDPKAFLSQDEAARKSIDQWKRDVEALAARPNTICKISGIIASVPDNCAADVLAPVVNHCLDSFGSDRVVFGGDWPVCLNGAPLAVWIRLLSEIIAERPFEAQQKLWSKNAIGFYGLQAALT